MATEELKKAEVVSVLQERDAQMTTSHPATDLAESIKALDKFGGFQLFKSLVRGLDNMDPKRKATKNIFLSELRYKDVREDLQSELQLWLDVIEQGKGDTQSMIESCNQKRDQAENNLSENLNTVRTDISKLEIAYRSLDSFFANSGQGKVDYLTIMNINKEDLATHDSDDTKAVRDEIHDNFDQISLKQHYSLLVLPGYLGDADTVRQWGKTAYENKVMLVTDFDDNSMYDSFDDLKNDIDDANLQGQDTFMSHVVMTCNYLLGRKRSETAKEFDDLYIPGSSALAGKMSNVDPQKSGTIISQGIAGMKHGTLDQVKGTRLSLKKSELKVLIDLGVIPMIESDGRTMAYSNLSLYNGGTPILQEYPIVRVFDWIGKVFQHFFDQETFRKWDGNTKAELTEAVHTFLSSQKGPDRLIENYTLIGIEQNKDTKDISIKVNLKPFYAARNYLIELTGHEDEKTKEQTFKQSVN